MRLFKTTDQTLFSISPNSSPLANTYKLSWELAEGAREGQVKLDGNVLAATTNNVANYIWQPTTTGNHKFIYTSGGHAVTQTVNVTSLSFPAAPTPNPPMARVAGLSITPATRSFPIGGGANAIVTSGAAWTAVASDSWITLNSTSGAAGYPVAYKVAASTAVGDRTGYVYVGGYTHTITQSGYESVVSPATISVGSTGGTGSVAVSIPGRYDWTAKPNVDWISISPVSGTGDGKVSYVVAPFTEVNTRSGTFTVAGRTVTVTQTGRSMRLSSNGRSFDDHYAHAIVLTVDALASTRWSVTPQNTWISVTDAGNGYGGDSVGLAIGENPSYLARTGTVRIGTETYTVTQAGRTGSALSFAVAPATTTASVNGANGLIAVTATPDLPWTVASQASWLTLDAPTATGTGNGNIGYVASPNSTLSERTGTIRVTPQGGLAAKTHTVTQPAATATLSASSFTFEAAGEACTVNVLTAAIVEWSISGCPSWIRVSGGTSGPGPKTVTLTATSNDSIYSRTGTLTIAGNVFTVTQLGRGVELEYDNKLFETDGGSDTISIHPDGGVAWDVTVSDPTWITVFGATSGTGDAKLEYIVSPYVGSGSARTGYIQIGSEKIWITQRPYELDINPKAAAVIGNAGAGEVGISAPIGAIWDAIPTEDWISVVVDRSRGIVTYTVRENDTGRMRTGKIIIAGEVYTITQMERLNVSVEGRGGVRIEGTYDYGAMMSLTATSAVDYAFSRWSGAATGTENPKTVAIEDVNRVVAVFTPVAPMASATTTAREGVTVSWSARAWATGYNIYRATTTTKPSSPHANVATGTTYSDTTAVPGTTYYYWVEAVGSQETAVSARVSGQRRVSLQTVTVSGSDALFSGLTATYTASSMLNSGAACTTGTKTWSVVGSAATVNSSGVLTAKIVSTDTTGTVRLTHTYDGITVTGEKLVTIRPTVALSALVRGGLSSVTTGGTKTWFGQKYDTCDGANAARSPALASGQSSWFSSTVTGPGTLTFKWRTTAAGERLAFGIGTDVTDRQETTTPDWQTVTRVYRDNATRTFRWMYTAGANNGYALVGGIVWTPAPASVTLTLNHQDGETANWMKTCTPGSAIGPMPVPVRTGYAFGGWYMEPSCVTRVVSADYSFVANQTLYAKWTANIYTVVFYKNGSTGTMASQVRTYDQAQNLPKIAFTRTGYAFVGWSTSASGAVVYNDGVDPGNLTANQGANVALYSKWSPISYTVRFSANGGSGSMTAFSQTYDVAKSLPANAFSRRGYTFAGWSTSAGGSAAYADKASVKNLTATAGQTVTLYAVWKANDYIVDFNPQGGLGTMPGQDLVYDSPEALDPNTFTRLGYTFIGWTDDPDEAEEISYVDGAIVRNLTDELNGEYDLYAVWLANDYEIWYDPNHGWGTMAVSPCVYDEETAIAANEFYRASHEFVGWATSASGVVAYANGQCVSNLRTTLNSAITLYAVWAAKSAAVYTVTFGRNAGEGGPDSIKVVKGVKGAAIMPPTRKGYTFGGYWTTTGADGVQYYAADGTPTRAWDKASNMTLWAKWTQNSYVVTLGKNGGTGGDAKVTVQYGVKPHDLVVPMRANYVFGGYWTTTGAGGVQYFDAAGKAVRNWDKTSEATLWAKWTEQTYRLTFGKNGGTGGDAHVTVAYGARPHDVSVPTKAGSTFCGYWTSTQPGGIQYYDASGKAVRTMDKKANVQLWAKWSNRITFGKNGGTGGDEYVTAYQGVVPHDITVPKRSGYVFDGYWTTTQPGGIQYYDASGHATRIWDKTSNMTLWAKWASSPACSVSKAKPAPSGFLAAVTDTPVPLPPYVRGVFADDAGVFDLLIDDSEEECSVGYLAAQTEDGVWSAECDILRSDVTTLILTFEDCVIVVRMSDGVPVATYATGL